MIFLIFLLLLIILVISQKYEGGIEIDKYVHTVVKKYIHDIKNGKLILHSVPKLFSNVELFKFPYTKYLITPENLGKIYDKLKTFKLSVNREKYDIPTKKFIESRFFGKWYSILLEERWMFYFDTIINYFQQKCRLKCRHSEQTLSALEYFKKNMKKYEEDIEKPINIEKYLKCIYVINRYMECSEFDPTWLTNLIPIFESRIGKIKNMLDMSAGRGSRMVACAALNINYVGTDPCVCANNYYEIMKQYVKYKGSKSSIKFIKSGFEQNWETNCDYTQKVLKSGGFDLMFSSPPYFTVELYEDNIMQSTTKYSDLESWLELWLKVCMKKILSMLRTGGIMAMNIDNSKGGDDFVNPMLNFKFDNAKFVGCTRIVYTKYNFKYHVWCWQKI